MALSLSTGNGGREDGGLKHTVPGSRKKLDNPHIPVAVIDGDWLTVGWTFWLCLGGVSVLSWLVCLVSW